MLLIHLKPLKHLVLMPHVGILITNASPWDNLKFDIEGIKEVQRKFFGTFIIPTSFLLCMPMWMGLLLKKNIFH